LVLPGEKIVLYLFFGINMKQFRFVCGGVGDAIIFGAIAGSLQDQIDGIIEPKITDDPWEQ
jgi:hypothetical protein